MGDTVYIGFCQDIQKKSVDTLISNCNFALKTYSPNNLYILFASGGGHIGLAFSLFSFLRSLPVNVITHGVANIDSCGVNVFLAGNERYATSNTTFLLHPSTKRFSKDVSLTINQLHLELATLQNDQTLVIKNISDNTGLSTADAEEFINLGKIFSSTQAKHFGIISEVKDFSMERNAPFLQI